MVSLTFITADGAELSVEGRPGMSLMEAARSAAVPGIEAECGGACSCATCHVYVSQGWVNRLPSPEAMETELLEFAWEPDAEKSRLSCQITITEELDGLTVSVPAQQG